MTSKHKTTSPVRNTAMDRDDGMQQHVAAQILYWPEQYIKSLPQTIIGVDHLNKILTETTSDIASMHESADALARSIVDDQIDTMVNLSEVLLTQLLTQGTRAIEVLNFQIRCTEKLSTQLLTLYRR